MNATSQVGTNETTTLTRNLSPQPAPAPKFQPMGERLILATLTTLTIIAISALHKTPEQSLLWLGNPLQLSPLVAAIDR
ncbi:MAG: hypothetical protein ACRC8A_09470 [Microcoleaceae cyanobacterium]